MRTAIVHPWFLANGGAEHTVNALAAMYPEADIFTIFYNQGDLPPALQGRRISAVGMNWLPAKYRYYRYLLPWYPMAFESLDLRGYDLILSSDSCVTKGVLVDQDALHICYCHSPMRCLWDQRVEFRSMLPAFARPVFSAATHYVRQWDFNAAQRVDHFIANSRNVAQRVQKFYRRPSTVIYPPVDTSQAALRQATGDYYLSVGRLTDMKRIDILIDAVQSLGRKLVVVGTGREERRLKALAGKNVEFLGHVSNETRQDLYANCRALLFAAHEDFGIVPIEAQAFGRPVIAYGVGGTLETVVDLNDRSSAAPTGIRFPQQTAASLSKAILRFEEMESRFDPEAIRRHALRFDSSVFVRRFSAFVDHAVQMHRSSTSQEMAVNFDAGILV